MLSFLSILLFFIAIFTTIVNVENAAELNKLNPPVLQKQELSNVTFKPVTKGYLPNGINNSVIPEGGIKIFSEGSEFTIQPSNANNSTTINRGLADFSHGHVPPPVVTNIDDSKYISGEKVASEKSTESKESKSDVRNSTPGSFLLNSTTVNNNGKVTKPQESKPVTEEKSVSEISVESVDPKTVQGITTTKSILINSPIVSTLNNSFTKTPEISGSNSTAEVNITTTKKPVPKKPLITIGSEGLPDSGIPDAITPEEALPSSSTTSDGAVPQFYQSSVNQPKGQPSYIIPIVITLFALPLLVLIGYQAVRRGKEAWRNRHYRRMDFLIDGMYND